MVPESGRTPPVPVLISICLIAISSDFFEIVLPNPLFSVAVVELFTGFRMVNSGTCEGLRGSGTSATCPLPCDRPLAVGSVSLPLVTMGDDCLLTILAGARAS